MPTVSVNPPKTPVTKGSNGMATATLPNVCKMPGPPAPFVPTPLPNIGQSDKQPQGYSKKVTIEGEPVAIQGASFGSSGDIASKGTGGGLVSSNAEGPTKFLGPGSMNVQIEGKNVQFLGDPMLNNCGPSGSPSNAATMGGVVQAFAAKVDERTQQLVNECDSEVNKAWDEQNPPGKKHMDCDKPTGKIDTKGKPVTVQQELGIKKEDCVYKKMGATPEALQQNAQKGHEKNGQGISFPQKTGKFAGCTVTVQKRFHPNGLPYQGGSGRGTIVPDIVMTGPDGVVSEVRELKFPCPSGDKKRGRWDAGQKEKYADAFNVAPKLIFPK